MKYDSTQFHINKATMATTCSLYDYRSFLQTLSECGGDMYASYTEQLEEFSHCIIGENPKKYGIRESEWDKHCTPRWEYGCIEYTEYLQLRHIR